MTRRIVVALVALSVSGLTLTARDAREHDAQAKPSAVQKPDGWNLPADADQLKSPLSVDDKILAQGRSVFRSKCQKCHGSAGRGDGPDADPDHREHMDLTSTSGAAKNPDGVVFHKVVIGRKNPKMPSFKGELSDEQIWAVVAYAQSLRKK